MAAGSNVAFTMKDVVLLAVSVYLLKQDVLRVVSADRVEKVAAASTGGTGPRLNRVKML
jgi:hypothetical protein